MSNVVAAVLLAGCSSDNWLGGIDGAGPSPSGGPERIDLDRDGYTVEEGDCDDLNPRMGPGAVFDEVCDGLDNDCSGVVDQERSALRVCDAQSRFDQVMEADVLFVIDHTVEMSGYLWRAALGAGALVRHVAGTGADSHIGVIYTDTENDKLFNGRLLAPADYDGLWLDGDDPLRNAEIHQRFLDETIGNVDYQYSGSEGARAAINASIVEHGDAYNDGFFRVGAPLNVVVISFDEDTSAPDNTGLFQMLATYHSGAPTKFYALTQTSEFACTGQRTSPAATIISLAQTTGGFYESICLGDYTGFLSSVGQAIAADALKDTFILDHPAQLTSLSVKTQAEGKPEMRWDGSYALTDPWTLVFPETPPPAGVAIIVDYEIDWRYEPAKGAH